MKSKAWTAAVLIAAQTIGASAVFAAQCASSNHVEARLQERFNETLAFEGAAREEHSVLVYASPKAESWTMVVATPDGMSCLMATGHGRGQLEANLGFKTVLALR